MKATQTKCILPVVVLAVMVPVTSAQAGVWGAVARGFEAFGYDFNGERNYLGNGWDINLNTYYSGQTYNFGFAELTLGEGSVTPSNIQVGYTMRGIPSAHFSWDTGGQALPYTFKVNNGIQDFSASGSMLVDVSTDINVLGFYDTHVQISNRADSTTDGFFANEDGNLDFDLGPIDVSGNIYADALAAITQPIWTAAGTENPFTQFSSAASKVADLNETIDQLRARIESGEILTDEEMSKLVNATLLSSIITGDSSKGNLLSELLTPVDETKATSAQPASLLNEAPEPTTMLLLFGPAAAFVLRRRR